MKMVYSKKPQPQKRNDLAAVIGIDPDAEKNGVAFFEIKTRKLEAMALTFAETLDYLQFAKEEAQQMRAPYKVVIEAGWLNKSHWHIRRSDSPQKAAMIGNSVGRNHETGRKIAEMCEHWEIPYELIKPLPLMMGGRYLWSGKDGKITAEEMTELTGLLGRTNQEMRDAALIAWVSGGMQIRNLRK